MGLLSSPAAATMISLGAAALWGSADFCGGLAVRRASPYLVVTVAHGLSLMLLAAVAVALKIPLPEGRNIGISLAAGIAGGIGLVLLYEALALGKMGLSASVGGVVTTMIPLLFSLRTEGVPHAVQLAGFVTAAVAIWMIAYAPGSAQPRGLGLAASAGICFGILLTLLKLAGSGGNGNGGIIWVMAFARMGSVGTVGPMAATLRKGDGRAGSTSLFSSPGLLVLIALAGVLDTGGNFLFTIATRIGRLDIAAVVSSLYPAATIVLAAWLLKERTTRIQAIGMGLALVAVAFISR